MAEPRIGVTFESSYESGLEKHLRNEQRRMAAMQKWLDNHPLEIRYRIDVNGIKAEVAKAKQAAMGELAKGGPVEILGAGGRPARETVAELAKVQGMLKQIRTTTYDAEGNIAGQFLEQVEQIGRGMERVSKFTKNEAGDFQLSAEIEKDIRSVKDLEDALRRVNKELGAEYANAAGRKDKDGQIAALKKQRAEVDKVMREAAKSGLVDSPVYGRAEDRRDRIDSRIAGLEGAGFSAAEKKARDARRRDVDREIKAEEARATAALKANKLETDNAERLLPDRAKYEAEINRLYKERAAIFERSRDYFRNLDKSLQAEGRDDLANRAFNRGLNAQSQVDQAGLDLNRAMTDSMRRGSKEAEAENAKQLKSDVDFANKRAQEHERQQAARLAADVDFGQKRIREAAAAERRERESQFRREMQDLKAQSEKRIAQINRNEKEQMRAAKDAQAKAAAAALGHQLRQSEYGNLAGGYLGVESRARRAGHTETADGARGRALAAQTAGEKDMERFARSTIKSGHALDFHSSSLLRNAGTFLRWQIPMRAVMSIQDAFMTGVESAIRVDRQYATLQTVFNGTADEAMRLKNETLDLAMAQGRSADEAMDASIRWSRLGLTRLQVLEATRVSLMAANVAEISAAESAEKLSGIYATYKLSVGDLSVVLNRLNSISNNYNVTVKDLFEGIARVSGVAKQSGLALRDLEGIIGAVTGATGRPGQEIGNALKMVITRLGDPKRGDQLKEAFGLDLTGPNGDLKDMSLILRELAEVYPTLNNAERQRFLMLTAGSRQAARMALVMTEYRQAQVLAAQAAMDHGASERENERILESLQSRIDSMKASWTELATAIGDAGAFDRAGNFMRYLQQIVMGFSDAIDAADEKARDFVINNPMFAEVVEKLGGGDDTLFGTRSGFDREEVEKTLRELEAARGKFGKKVGMGEFLLNGPDSLLGDRKVRVGGMNGLNVTEEDADKAIAVFRKMLEMGGDNGFQDKLQETTRDVSNLRNEVEGLDRAEWTFRSLGQAVAESAVDSQSMIREFQAMSSLLLSLPDGQRRYSDAVREFNHLATSGDADGIVDLMERLAGLFEDASAPKADELAAAMKATSSVLDTQIAELEARKSKLLESPPSDDRDASLEEYNTQLKDLRGALQQVNGAVEEFDKTQRSAFGHRGKRNINDYLSDVLAASAAIGEAFRDFAPDAANDPVDRVIARHRRAVESARDALGQVRDMTEKEAAERRDRIKRERKIIEETGLNGEGSSVQEIYEKSRPKPGEMLKKLAAEKKGIQDVLSDAMDSVGRMEEVRRYRSVGPDQEAMKAAEQARARELEQQDEAEELVRTAIQNEEERIEQLQRELEYQEAILRVQRRQTDAQLDAERTSAAFRFGETESDKDANQARAVIERARQSLNQAGADRLLTRDTPETRADAAGRVLQDEATARAALDSMQRRNASIDAERRQIAYDTLQAMRQQTEEASKRYQLASREDQLRASVLARSLRGGAIGLDEFSMLGQNSRQALVNYLPGQAPGSLNDVGVAAERRRQELDDEQRRLQSSIAEVGASLAILAERITKDSAKGGALDPTAGMVDPKSLQNAAETRDGRPEVRIDIGGVHLQMRLAEEVPALIRTVVEPMMMRQIQELEVRLRSRPIPNAQGVVE